MIRTFCAFALLSIALVNPLLGAAREVSAVAVTTGATQVTVTRIPATMKYGDMAHAHATAEFPGMPCSAAGDLHGRMQFWVNGLLLNVMREEAYAWFPLCYPNPFLQFGGDILLNELAFGTHEIAAEYFGNHIVPNGISPPARVTVLPHFSGRLDDGTGLDVGVAPPGGVIADTCNLANFRVGSVGSAGWPSEPPPNASVPLAFAGFDSTGCQLHYLSSLGMPAAAGPVNHRVLLESSRDLPRGTVAYAYGATTDNPAPHWYPLRTSVSGGRALFHVTDGAAGDHNATRDGTLRAVIALAVPEVAATYGNYQDLWWAGPQENGWGLNLTQHREMLFGELFIYDDAGEATWLVMSSGQWDESRTTFTGSVYRPRGTGFFNYHVIEYAIGAPVGSLALTFTGDSSMQLAYEIDGIQGSRELTRIPFGPKHAMPLPSYGDLWWAGPNQNGWGLVVAQQHRSLFALWFTYDERGKPTWFAAPSGKISTAKESSRELSVYDFEGTIYKPRGSPWLGAPYDASRHSMTAFGTLKLKLHPDNIRMDFDMPVAKGSEQLVRVPF